MRFSMAPSSKSASPRSVITKTSTMLIRMTLPRVAGESARGAAGPERAHQFLSVVVKPKRMPV